MAKAPQILTANRLRDGEVLYWRAGGWVSGLEQAEIFSEDADSRLALTSAEAFVRDSAIVNPYLFDIRVDSEGVHPLEEREIIRAAGPTVRHDLGKQARHVSL